MRSIGCSTRYKERMQPKTVTTTEHMTHNDIMAIAATIPNTLFTEYDKRVRHFFGNEHINRTMARWHPDLWWTIRRSTTTTTTTSTTVPLTPEWHAIVKIFGHYIPILNKDGTSIHKSSHIFTVLREAKIRLPRDRISLCNLYHTTDIAPHVRIALRIVYTALYVKKEDRDANHFNALLNIAGLAND